MRDPSVVHIRLGLRPVAPIVESAADRVRQAGRHVDEDIPQIIGPPGLQHQYLVAGIGAQPVRQHTASRPAANDDRVELLHGFLTGPICTTYTVDGFAFGRAVFTSLRMVVYRPVGDKPPSARNPWNAHIL